jgi:hypothetical protein
MPSFNGGMSYKELGEIFLAQKNALADLSAEKKVLQAEHDLLRLTIIPEKMDEDGMTSINIKGVGRLGVTLDAYVTVLVENRGQFYAWLEESGNGGLIKPYAQPATIKAFIKEQVKNGEDIPEDLVSCEPFYRATVTKK